MTDQNPAAGNQRAGYLKEMFFILAAIVACAIVAYFIAYAVDRYVVSGAHNSVLGALFILAILLCKWGSEPVQAIANLAILGIANAALFHVRLAGQLVALTTVMMVLFALKSSRRP